MVSKTRDRFIEVARQLFARKGIENTTMHDIASASDKGRRTIYTYFKSKRDIFNAVIEKEIDQLLDRLNIIVKKPISPEEKLREYLDCRFETVKELVSRNGSLKAGFFRDVRKVERARQMIFKREILMLKFILQEGVEQGIFEVDNLNHAAILISNAVNGLDVPYIRDNLKAEGIEKSMLKDYIFKLFLYGLKVR